ncbi:sugar phosphate isomerase/epimerase family protein [Bacillus sp. UMB0893]|uniref:sugar phosphate isomerase/epimerase family protein n=1 Tax=Bacillus sp. UMB0893 TaxID=2066053 RepID=UPI001C60C056|nr:TIM barrel protein [Bacillus sp. UMB0893]
MLKSKFAVQLFTLRAELDRDFKGTLQRVKKIGYDAVQLGNFHGYHAEEISVMLKDLDLKTAGLHASIDRLRTDLDQVVKEAEILQTRDIICPYLPEELRNAKSYIRIKNALNNIANTLMDKGFRISYHNHAFEFQTEINDMNALDYILDPSEENHILAEIDVYWIKIGGHDPLTYIERFSNRMPIIHLKDVGKDENHSFAEVGTGILDFPSILQWGEVNGIEWYVVEQDVCPRNPLDCLELSLRNLHEMADRMQSH